MRGRGRLSANIGRDSAGEGRMQMHDGRPETLQAIAQGHREGDQRGDVSAGAAEGGDHLLVDVGEFLGMVAGYKQLDVVGAQRRRLIGDGLLQVRSDAAHNRLGDMKDTRACGFVHGVIRLLISRSTRPAVRQPISSPAEVATRRSRIPVFFTTYA